MNNIYEEEHCSDLITMLYKSKVCPPLYLQNKTFLKKKDFYNKCSIYNI